MNNKAEALRRGCRRDRGDQSDGCTRQHREMRFTTQRLGGDDSLAIVEMTLQTLRTLYRDKAEVARARKTLFHGIAEKLSGHRDGGKVP